MTSPPDDPHAPGGPAPAEVIPIGRKKKTAAPLKPLPLIEHSWQLLLRYNARNELTRDPGNAALILTNDQEWAGALQYDEFADRVTWLKLPPAITGLTGPAVGDALADHHIVYCQHWLAKFHFTSFTREAITGALVQSARSHTIHPVRDYLRGLQWDGRLRIHNWLTTYLHASEDDTSHHVGRLWLISAVARVMDPGCQADHLLVLEGAQGSGKSTAARVMGGPWYLGNLPDLRDKDSQQVLRGKWIIEIAELDAIRGSAQTRVKEYLTRTVETYRPAYGEYFVDQRRQCVFMATTNDDHYLQDATGARRYWPVATGRLDRKALERDRDQLWAEAHQAYLQGEQWWPNEELTEQLVAVQDDRYQTDDWQAKIEAHLDPDLNVSAPSEVSIGDLLSTPLGLPPGQHTISHQTRVGAIMKRLKWRKIRGRLGKSRLWKYARPLI